MVFKLPLHLGVDVVGADDEIAPILVLQERGLHADPGRCSPYHKAVFHGKAAVPFQDRHDLFFVECAKEAFSVFRVDEPLHVLPAQGKEILSRLFHTHGVVFPGRAVLHELSRIRLHDINAEIVVSQRFCYFFVGYPLRRDLPVFRLRLSGVVQRLLHGAFLSNLIVHVLKAHGDANAPAGHENLPDIDPIMPGATLHFPNKADRELIFRFKLFEDIWKTDLLLHPFLVLFGDHRDHILCLGIRIFGMAQRVADSL